MTRPPYLHPPYNSTHKRAPTKPPIAVPLTLSETAGPRVDAKLVAPSAADLTRQHAGEPLGERIVVGGLVLDELGKPLPSALVEIWQCNAAGRYLHEKDRHHAPLDPNFTGAGQILTDEHGRYRFVTIRPGAYPWRNHQNAWRPSHIHFSLFGAGFASRLVTQMYFPGDPLLAFDPIFNCVPDEGAKRRLIAEFDWESTTPEWALGYRFDVVLRGSNATPLEGPRHGA
ncbi:MAG: protocatechuate 3,4-dioxygenase subunit beta [Myxococcota bacterium]|nr:protocatechuate 3,4-dioxygenase subunit beta [Myxococcota bacterium]